MANLTPRAFDIETSGLGEDAVITVAGLASDIGCWLALNTDGRDASPVLLEDELERLSGTAVTVDTVDNERELLESLSECVEKRINGDRHYLCAFNGETWNGGFDLPFLRTACIRNNRAWPFGDVAYADVMQMLNRVDTGDTNDLVGVYDILIGEESCDPFEESKEAVTAWEEGECLAILKHNLADIKRTRELAVLAGQYVPRSDFRIKNLSPPSNSRIQ